MPRTKIEQETSEHLTTFDGYIRSLNSASVAPHNLSRLNAYFPKFFDLEDSTKSTAKTKSNDNPYILVVHKTLPPWFFDDTFSRPENTPPRPHPPRRFAGHHDEVTFPRRRYYSIAHTAAGNDGGTLLRELLAYAAPGRRFLVADTSMPDDALFLKRNGIETSSRDSLVVVLDQNIRDSDDIVEIPLLTQRVVVTGCVDLRIQKTQEWFLRQFKDGNQHIFFSPEIENKVEYFTDLLPGLMWPSLGGGHLNEFGAITRAIGSWMRLNRVAALIFPSARSDVCVRYKSGAMVDFYGWNLVDYRGTGDKVNVLSREPATTAMMSGWPAGFPYPCTLRYDTSGSWQVSGPEAFLYDRVLSWIGQ